MKDFLILGLGRMGSALAKALSENQVSWEAVEPKIQSHGYFNDKLYQSLDEVDLSQYSNLLLCVEPADVQKICENLNAKIDPDLRVVSVAAGVRLEQLKSWIPRAKERVRLMPNTPIQWNEGCLVACSDGGSSGLSALEKSFAKSARFFSTDERNFDMITVLCGSGPAVAYQWLDWVASAAEKSGLDRKMAGEIFTRVMRGATRAMEESGQSAADLIEQVVTPGGCTHATLESMKSQKMGEAIAEAFLKGEKRASELGQG